MRIDIAKEMAKCVKAIGGHVLDEALENPTFENADYWFPEYNVVAELKQLTEDIGQKPEYGKQLANLYAKWIREGLVKIPSPGLVQLNTKDIPEKCVREWTGLFKKRLESSTIQKSNSQIKKTKEYLNAPEARGLLILANDGNLALHPSLTCHLIHRLMRTYHSSIHSVIYFSANHPVNVPQLPNANNHFWIDGLIEARIPAPKELRKKLRGQWFKNHAVLTEGPTKEFLMANDAELMEGIQFKSNREK